MEVAIEPVFEVPAEMASTDSIVDLSIDTLTTYFENTHPDSCLAHFIHQLSCTDDTLVRIIFFGDSQLEGDFFTKTVRTTFQDKYGGCGIGYMPAEMYFNTTEQVAIISSDFEKQSVRSGVAKGDEFGLYGHYYTALNDHSVLRIKNRNTQHRYQRLKIIYSGSSDLVVQDENRAALTYSLASTNVEEQQIEFEQTPPDLKLKFSENKQFKIYGILLDGASGVVVDHVPFRGNLNLMLNIFGGVSVEEMSKIVHPSLIVLQYGLNVIPDVRPTYKSYRIALQRDIHLLKKFLPDVSILVLGAPDMAHKVNGEMQAYANIDLIIEAQKAAAQNEHVAFWNTRAAMGGTGSVIEWVNDDLARTDYAHLNAKGSKKLATIFVNDLMLFIEQNTIQDAGITEK
ncbi:MAG: hypothetical protein ACERKD_24315 [Prolixibacteraceae bacterium]